MCFTGGKRGQRVQLTVSSMGYVGEIERERESYFHGAKRVRLGLCSLLG